MFFCNFCLGDKYLLVSFSLQTTAVEGTRVGLRNNSCLFSEAMFCVLFCLLILGETGSITSWPIVFFLNAADMLTSVKMNHLGCLSSTEENAIQYSRPVNPATLKLVTLDMWKYFVREALHHLSVVGNITHPLWAWTFKTAFVAELLYFAWYFTGVAAIVSTPL